MKCLLTFFTFLLFCVQVQGREISPNARDAVETIKQLRAIGLSNPGHHESDPPLRVPILLRQLNQQLRALITETLNDDRRNGTIPSEDEILTELRDAGWQEIPRHKWNAYGEIRNINVNSAGPGLLAVATELWVPCGSADPDSAVHVFTGQGRRWKLVMSVDADFDPVGDSDETGRQFQASPPDDQGQWFMVVANTPPTCRSVPADLRYRVLRPGASPDEARTLFEDRRRLDPRFSPPFRLHVEKDGFNLTTGKVRKLDGEPGVSISTYQLKGDQVVRVQPLAPTPEDFLDEWAQLDWNEAAQWSNQSATSSLQQWHSRLESLAPNSAELGFVQECPHQASIDRTWLIDLWIDQKQSASGKDELLYIGVTDRSDGLFVDSVSQTRRSGCPKVARHHARTSWQLPE